MVHAGATLSRHCGTMQLERGEGTRLSRVSGPSLRGCSTQLSTALSCNLCPRSASSAMGETRVCGAKDASARWIAFRAGLLPVSPETPRAKHTPPRSRCPLPSRTSHPPRRQKTATVGAFPGKYGQRRWKRGFIVLIWWWACSLPPILAGVQRSSAPPPRWLR